MVRVKTYDIEQRAFEFACRVADMELALVGTARVGRRRLQQLSDAAGSIGANLEEARAAQSRADFHAKVRISLKEARESKYWLRLIARSSGLPLARFSSLIKEAGEIVAILTTIARNANPRG